MKIVYYNCEITEQAVGENQNSCVLAAETSNAYAQRVAQMEQDSFDDAWTEAMVADSLAQSHNHLWLVEDDAGTPCGYLLANVLGDETELLRIAVNPECRKDGIGQLLMDAYLAFARIDADDGKCRADRAFDNDRTEGTGARGQFTSDHCTGASV